MGAHRGFGKEEYKFQTSKLSLNNRRLGRYQCLRSIQNLPQWSPSQEGQEMIFDVKEKKSFGYLKEKKVFNFNLGKNMIFDVNERPNSFFNLVLQERLKWFFHTFK